MLAQEQNTLHPGLYQQAEQQAFEEAVTLLFMDVCKDHCVPDAIAIVNRKLRRAYGRRAPATLHIDPGTGMVKLSMHGNTAILAPHRSRKNIGPKAGGGGNGKGGRSNGEGGGGDEGWGNNGDDSNEPPGPQWWAIFLLSGLIFYGWLIWKFIKWLL